MNAWWQTPLVVLAVMGWLAAPAKSLGEAAQREALRRQLTPKSQVLLTNAGQPPEIPIGGIAVTAPPDEPPVGVSSAGAPPAGAPPAGAPPDDSVEDEKWWRTRVDAANQTLKRDEDTAGALQERINALQRDVVNVDDPIRQAELRAELTRTVEELERTKKLIDQDRRAIEGIQDDARRQNVPPGWIR